MYAIISKSIHIIRIRIKIILPDSVRGHNHPLEGGGPLSLAGQLRPHRLLGVLRQEQVPPGLLQLDAHLAEVSPQRLDLGLLPDCSDVQLDDSLVDRLRRGRAVVRRAVGRVVIVGSRFRPRAPVRGSDYGGKEREGIYLLFMQSSELEFRRRTLALSPRNRRRSLARSCLRIGRYGLACGRANRELEEEEEESTNERKQRSEPTPSSSSGSCQA